MIHKTNTSLVTYRPVSKPRARIFCLPYAGGGARIFSRWHLGLPEDVEVQAVELPGRGTRAREPLWAGDIGTLVEDLALEIAAALDAPYFLWGHSMGALLAFMCTRELRRRGLPQPARLFVSGRKAPHRPGLDGVAWRYSDRDFIAMLRERGGTPPEVLDEPELMALLVPIVRSDFRLIDSYQHSTEAPLECPITAFGGTRDGLATPHDMAEWRIHTTGSFDVETVAGNHFFIDANRDVVVERVAGYVGLSRKPERVSA
jgi:surfactin synthase thioesterase subunit